MTPLCGVATNSKLVCSRSSLSDRHLEKLTLLAVQSNWYVSVLDTSATLATIKHIFLWRSRTQHLRCTILAGTSWHAAEVAYQRVPPEIKIFLPASPVLSSIKVRACAAAEKVPAVKPANRSGQLLAEDGELSPSLEISKSCFEHTCCSSSKYDNVPACFCALAPGTDAQTLNSVPSRWCK